MTGRGLLWTLVGVGALTLFAVKTAQAGEPAPPPKKKAEPGDDAEVIDLDAHRHSEGEEEGSGSSIRANEAARAETK